MPSKLLIAAASAAHAAGAADLFGIRVSGIRIDGPAVLARVRAERDRFVGSVFEGLDALPPEERLEGEARFLDANTLALGDHTRIAFRAAVIATGSGPVVPVPLRGLGERLLTTDTLFEIPDLPGSLAILGAGAVGIEIAQAMARLGVAVTVIDAGPGVAGLSEPDLVRQAAGIFGDAFALHLRSELREAVPDGDGVRLTWSDANGRTRTLRAARVLAAAGRAPNLDGLGLDAAGLQRDADGLPDFDRRSLVCRGGPILIAGDADGWRPVLHEASRQGRIAGANAAALATGASVEAPEPWPALAMVFTDPQAALVGAPFDADAAGRIVGAVDFSDQGRARVEGRAQGGLRLWADANGRLLGGEMLGPAVEHLAHRLADALCQGLTARDMIDRPTYHPTLEEGLATALSEIAHKSGCA